MGDTMSDRERHDNLVSPQDVAVAATVSTNTNMYRSMAKYDYGTVVVTALLTNLKTCIAQLTQATDAAGTSKGNVSGFTCTLTGAAAGTGLNQVGTIDFTAADLQASVDGEYFVGVDLTTNQNGDDVQAVLIRGGARYKEATMDA